MKLRNLLRSMVLAGVAVAGSANAVVVFTEDFESFGAAVAPGGFAPQSDFGNPLGQTFGFWTVFGGIDLIRELSLGSHDNGSIANISVDMLGTPGPGTLSRTFTAIAGLTYSLSWDWFRNDTGSPLKVTLGTTTIEAGAPFAISHSHLDWVATSSGLQTVAFTGVVDTQAFRGSTIDNVVLSAVPEPGPTALVLMGLGVVGFLARRRMKAA